MRLIFKAFLILSWLSAALPAQAAPVPAAPKIAATGHLLMDYHSGAILAENNAGKRLEPASLTKIMTAYTVFKELEEGNISLNDQVLVSKKAWKTPGSRMFIEVGKQVSVDDLIHGMIIASGNDACVALAEHIAGNEEAFAALMNKHVLELGMENTHFTNATGLPDPNHYTTPEDILKVTRAVIREFPQFYPLYSIKEFTYNGITQKNRNRLLWRDPSVDGVKTGHTEAAGYCLVTSAKRENMRLLSVVMGTASDSARAKESQTLLNFGFRFYQTHRLFDGGETLKQLRVWKGEVDNLNLGLEEDLYVTIPRGSYNKLTARIHLKDSIMAPVPRGKVLGKVIIEHDGEIIKEVPLVALRGVREGGIIHNLVDSVLMIFQ
ncbi:MAG TPA: D-alanyl-D-alanine carboxypeptidase [Thiolapillus brandeum]|uniref:serine-type D-Ala-D-Ala carboxypeptidase n=1 Tax=Thiolapillus brandeum TaxID=1076588 RepID=A0A831RTX8_9GAMM|nr:D-alanyl-D-alanine carboxypeptidase [Thiolapillus brandeum]